MSNNSKQLLKKQLEQQARLFVSSQSETDLVLSIMATCSVLLQVAEKETSATVPLAESESVYAGCLGVSSKLASFYKKNLSSVNSLKSQQLETIFQTIQEEEIRKKDLESRLSQAEEQNQQLSKDVRNSEQLLGAENQKKQALTEKKSRLEKQRNEAVQKNESMNLELESLKEQIESLEPSIESLIREVSSAKETYEEMMAYYSEIRRIENGIKEEGYVDLNSLNDRIQSMNDTGTNLMKEYDSLLTDLSADVETLRSKIEERRKPGITG